MTENIIIALIGLVGGGGLTEILRFFAGVKTLSQKISDLEAKIDRNEAIGARVRILHFSDEVMRKVQHSHESFEQTLEDIDTYEDYCDKHPEFKNNKTVLSAQRIKQVYGKCLEEGTFL